MKPIKTLPTCEESHREGDAKEIERGLDPDRARRMAEFFSLLGDANRLRILSLLAARESCVCDLAGALDMSESAVSHQLRTLRALRLVKYHKQGRRVYYQLLDHHVLDLYSAVREHLEEPSEDE